MRLMTQDNLPSTEVVLLFKSGENEVGLTDVDFSPLLYCEWQSMIDNKKRVVFIG